MTTFYTEETYPQPDLHVLPFWHQAVWGRPSPDGASAGGGRAYYVQGCGICGILRPQPPGGEVPAREKAKQ